MIAPTWTASTLSACLATLPEAHFQAETWEGNRTALVAAVQEWLAYTHACRAVLTALDTLPAVPWGESVGEWV